MTQHVKGHILGSVLVTCLAIAAMLVLAGATAAEAGGAKDSAESVRMTSSGKRRSGLRPSGPSSARKRARVKALAGRRDPFKVPPPPHLNGRGDEPDGLLPPGVRGLLSASCS